MAHAANLATRWDTSLAIALHEPKPKPRCCGALFCSGMPIKNPDLPRTQDLEQSNALWFEKKSALLEHDVDCEPLFHE